LYTASSSATCSFVAPGVTPGVISLTLAPECVGVLRLWVEYLGGFHKKLSCNKMARPLADAAGSWSAAKFSSWPMQPSCGLRLNSRLGRCSRIAVYGRVLVLADAAVLQSAAELSSWPMQPDRGLRPSSRLSRCSRLAVCDRTLVLADAARSRSAAEFLS
jgi:hypothetical protein